MSELSLTWDDHHNTLVGVFEKLLESSSLVDCTLAAEGQYIKAHKIILSACSPYFELLFKQETEKNPIVVLKDIKFKELKAMINFIYRGEVKVPEERLGDFVDAAESLQIKGLGGHGYESPKPVESELTIIKRGESSTSAHPRKRRRRSYVSNGEDDSRTTSVSETVHKDISSSVSVSLVQVDKNNSTQNNQSVSALRKTAEVSLMSISTRSEQTLKTSESVSLTTCILPDLTTTDNDDDLENVIKCEPETVPEAILPDLEIIETKKESFTEQSLSQELVIDSEGDTSETNTRFDDSEICANQFPSFSTTLHPSSGAENFFVPSVIPEANRVQGRLRLESLRPPPPPRERPRPRLRPRPRPRPRARGGRGRGGRGRGRGGRGGGDGGYACPFCSRVFARQSGMLRHISIHTGEKPYICHYCGRPFREEKNMRQHTRLHTGEKPFACHLCDYRSAFGSGLSYHKRKFHGLLPADSSAKAT